eukprot:gnl/MRDRNA2_/MRDRNA2_123392_c0_seq1.p1 gnl/MRDRNA2_/MRDRNA2_123392_c0~~gnl/MRDRNA2_/MRDRNA2_123392_c0_seq1.p1  ORF type:complete len:835 (+),score=129.39 gnl/MRDRNA2_/MRDRNA2_123392_c0_seq1:168-2507(+)
MQHLFESKMHQAEKYQAQGSKVALVSSKSNLEAKSKSNITQSGSSSHVTIQGSTSHISTASRESRKGGRRRSSLQEFEIAAANAAKKKSDFDTWSSNNKVHEVFDKFRLATTSKTAQAGSNHDYDWFRYFNFLVYVAIMVSSVQLGLQIDYPENGEVYYWMEIACNIIFVLEMMIKLALFRIKYFHDGWNIFDFSLVMITVVDFAVNQLNTLGNSGSASNLPGLRALRMFRAVRVLRVLKVFRELWLIVRGIVLSLRAMTWVICLLVMILYMSGILCTTVMEDVGPMYPGYSKIDEIPGGENMEYFNPNEMFGTIPRSMYTLFQLALLTEFSEFGRPIFEKQPLFFPFFLFFIFVVTFGVLNVLIAVIVEVTMEASESLKQEEGDREMRHKLELLDQLQEFVFLMDEAGTGEITLQQLAVVHQDEKMQKLLVTMGFPLGFTAEELWTLLDQDGSGTLQVEEFVRMAFRLVSCSQDQFQFQCVLLSNLSRLQHSVNCMKESQPLTPGNWDASVEEFDAQMKEQPKTNNKKVQISDERPQQQQVAPQGSERQFIPETRSTRSCGYRQKAGSYTKAHHSRRSRRNCRAGARVRRRCNHVKAAMAYLNEAVPEVETNPSGVVRAEQLEKLLATRLHDALPCQMLPDEIKGLLEWRKHDEGLLKYKDLEESVACLAACREDIEVFKCLLLSSVTETQRQATATHRVCTRLLGQNCVIDPVAVGGEIVEFAPRDQMSEFVPGDPTWTASTISHHRMPGMTLPVQSKNAFHCHSCNQSCETGGERV